VTLFPTSEIHNRQRWISILGAGYGQGNSLVRLRRTMTQGKNHQIAVFDSKSKFPIDALARVRGHPHKPVIEVGGLR